MYDDKHHEALKDIPPDVIATQLMMCISAWFHCHVQQRDGFTETDIEIMDCARRVACWCDEQKLNHTWSNENDSHTRTR